jgi:hypothetical protein
LKPVAGVNKCRIWLLDSWSSSSCVTIASDPLCPWKHRNKIGFFHRKFKSFRISITCIRCLKLKLDFSEGKMFELALKGSKLH